MLKRKIKIAVIMTVEDPELSCLVKSIDSVLQQTYSQWQLCLVSNGTKRKKTISYLKSLNDKRVFVKFLKKRVMTSVALNTALGLTKASYVALIDNSDFLATHALEKVALAVNKTDPDLIYSDEDSVDLNGNFINPHYKSDYSPDTILSHNYIGHLLVLRMGILNFVGKFDKSFKAAYGYDFLLRSLENVHKIYHIPEILYHCKLHPFTERGISLTSSLLLKEERRALNDACRRQGVLAAVLPGIHLGTYRVKRKIEGRPLVTVIIPFRDKPDFLKRCLDSILEQTSYDHFNILCMDNDSREASTARLMKEYALKYKQVTCYKHAGPFNFSRINNCAVRLTKAEHVILLNNDMEIITPGWIEALLEHSQRPEVGAVGAKLYYPGGNVQHAGVVIGIKEAAGHAHKNLGRHHSGYFYRSQIIQNVSSVTAACLMVKRRLYMKLGGLNEVNLPIAFNDTDFCLRLAERGYLNIFTPYCELYHYEAATRGRILSLEMYEQVMKDIAYFRKRHRTILKRGDPYYNPNFPLHTECFGLLTGTTRLVQPVGSNISF